MDRNVDEKVSHLASYRLQLGSQKAFKWLHKFLMQSILLNNRTNYWQNLCSCWFLRFLQILHWHRSIVVVVMVVVMLVAAATAAAALSFLLLFHFRCVVLCCVAVQYTNICFTQRQIDPIALFARLSLFDIILRFYSNCWWPLLLHWNISDEMFNISLIHPFIRSVWIEIDAGSTWMYHCINNHNKPVEMNRLAQKLTFEFHCVSPQFHLRPHLFSS